MKALPRLLLSLILVLATPAMTSAAEHQQATSSTPKIQLAILLDTSSSMDGLIDQTRKQLWQIVDEFSKTTKHNVTPTLEVAVYEYGNDNLQRQQGYTRRLVGLTGDLDRVSEALFSLTTNGGSEYCGYAIKRAIEGLQWSPAEDDIKAIFIAGNEPFSQGPVNYKNAISLAQQSGIVVNTIHAGDYAEGAQSGWREGALLAGGDYMHINHNHQIAQIAAPQDQAIATLNQQLNKTYIPYGKDGEKGRVRQEQQDQNSNKLSLGLLAKRAKTKASSLYDNSNWDLVDALSSGSVDLNNVEQAALPEPMRAMSPNEQKNFIEEKREARKKIQHEIKELSAARDKYIAEKENEALAESVNTMNDAVISAIRKQGEKKAFSFFGHE